MAKSQSAVSSSDKYLYEAEERRIRAEKCAAKGGNSPKSPFLGYADAEADDGRLEPDTHPTGFVAVTDIIDPSTLRLMPGFDQDETRDDEGTNETEIIGVAIGPQETVSVESDEEGQGLNFDRFDFIVNQSRMVVERVGDVVKPLPSEVPAVPLAEDGYIMDERIGQGYDLRDGGFDVDTDWYDEDVLPRGYGDPDVCPCISCREKRATLLASMRDDDFDDDGYDESWDSRIEAIEDLDAKEYAMDDVRDAEALQNELPRKATGLKLRKLRIGRYNGMSPRYGSCAGLKSWKRNGNTPRAQFQRHKPEQDTDPRRTVRRLEREISPYNRFDYEEELRGRMINNPFFEGIDLDREESHIRDEGVVISMDEFRHRNAIPAPARVTFEEIDGFEDPELSKMFLESWNSVFGATSSV
jgi:hypothetical protein